VPSPDTVLGLRDRALLEVLYGTGVRVSEAVGLDVDEVARLVSLEPDVPTPGLRVLGKGRKERIVPLGSYARVALDAYLVRARPELVRRGSGTPALFLNGRGGRLSRQSAWTILRTVAEQAGVAAEVSPHTLRHCFATHLLDGGADVRVVQELLGHASVTSTQIYTLVTVDHLREVYLTSHPRAY
jgi:integrase/recombinase XerD